MIFEDTLAAKISEVKPTVLIATMNPSIDGRLADLLRTFHVRTIWVKSLQDAKFCLATQDIAVCLCGFWLEGGTYLDLVECVANGPAEIPVIVASGSESVFASEHQHHLAALNSGVFDFISYPYQPAEFQKLLEFALKAHYQSVSPHRQAAHVDPMGATQVSLAALARTNSFHIGQSGLSH